MPLSPIELLLPKGFARGAIVLGSACPSVLVPSAAAREPIDLVRFVSELGKPGSPYISRPAGTVGRWKNLRDVPPQLTSGIPNLPSSTLLSKTLADHDEQGRVYRTETFSVDSGVVSSTPLTTNTFFDHASQTLAVSAVVRGVSHCK